MTKRQSLCHIEWLQKDEIPGICRVYHGLTPKPASVVEWGVGSSGSLLAPPFARLSTYRKNEHPESERHSGSRVLACLRPLASAASPNSRSRPFRFSASDLFDWEPAAESGQREPREGEHRGHHE